MPKRGEVAEVTVVSSISSGRRVYVSSRPPTAPVRKFSQLLPDRPVTALDIAAGHARYTRLLRALLEPYGLALAASDVSAHACHSSRRSRGHAVGWCRCCTAAEQLPFRPQASIWSPRQLRSPLRPSAAFLTSVSQGAGARRPAVLYTRTPQHKRGDLGAATSGFHRATRQRLRHQPRSGTPSPDRRSLKMIATQTFTIRARARPRGLQARPRAHYSRFSLYKPTEGLLRSIATFLARLPTPRVLRVDSHLLVVNRRQPPQPGGAGRPGAGRTMRRARRAQDEPFVCRR